jgi:hypothetical protein
LHFWQVWFVLAVLLALLHPPSCAATEGQPGDSHPTHGLGAQHVDVLDFAAEADRIHEAIAALGEDPEAARALRGSIPDQWEVGRSAYPVSMTDFKGQLAAFASEPNKRNDLRAQLDVRARHLEELAAALTDEASAARDSRPARARLDEILQRKEFRAVRQPNLLEQWKEKASRWLRRMLGRWIDKFRISPNAGSVMVWVLIGALFILLAIWLGRRLSKSRLLGLSLEAPAPTGKNWRDWATAALAAAKEGRHREALHAAYWAGVYRLEELGAWQLDRTRTPREYLRLLRSRPPASAPPASAPAFSASQEQRAALETLTRNFELAWYGYQTAGETDFRNAIEQLEVLGCHF